MRTQPGSDDTAKLVTALTDRKAFLGGQKATLVWDGLPAHRSHAMHAWLATQRSWLVVERLPANAADLKGGRVVVVEREGPGVGQPHRRQDRPDRRGRSGGRRAG